MIRTQYFSALKVIIFKEPACFFLLLFCLSLPLNNNRFSGKEVLVFQIPPSSPRSDEYTMV